MFSHTKRYGKAIAVLALALVSCTCPFLVPKIEAELSGLVLCKGWDTDENPILSPDVVPLGETKICICGHLETNHKLFLQIYWRREGKTVSTYVQEFDN